MLGVGDTKCGICKPKLGIYKPYWVSQWQVIDIMTFNSYSLQYYSFWKGKIGFARTVPVSWTTPMSIASVTVWQLTVSKNEFFALQITDNSFGKWIFLVAYGKKSLEEIFFKMLLRKKYFREIEDVMEQVNDISPKRYSLTVDSLWKDTDEHGSF